MKTTESGTEIEPANPIARIAFAAIIVLFILAAIGSDAFFERIGEWLSEDPDLALERVEEFIAWVAVASLPLLIIGVFVFRTGLKSIASERFPPQGMWVLVDTPVISGTRAKWRGRMMLVAAVLIAAVAIGLPAGLWYIIHSVAESS